MVNGFEIQQYERCKELAEEFQFKIELSDKFRLMTKEKERTLCIFNSVSEVFCFLCGYEYGRSTKK